MWPKCGQQPRRRQRPLVPKGNNPDDWRKYNAVHTGLEYTSSDLADGLESAWVWAQFASHWPATAGHPLASALIRHWLEGTGTAYQMTTEQIHELAGTMQMHDAAKEAEARLFRREDGLIGTSETREVNETVSLPDYVGFGKPDLSTLTSTETDMFLAFHNIDDCSVTFHGNLRAGPGGSMVFEGTINWHISDHYVFQNRPTKHPIPQSSVTDRDFWLLQVYGLARGFYTVGDWTETGTFAIENREARQAAPPSPKGGYPYGHY